MFKSSNTYTSTPPSYFGGLNGSDFGIDVGFTRTNDLLLTTSTNESTSNLGHAIGVDDEWWPTDEENEEGSETDNDPIQESRPNGVKISIIVELDPIPTEPEDGGSDGEASDIAR